MSDANAHLLAGDIEEALNAARHGKATSADWSLIYWACGLRQQHQADHFFGYLTIGDLNDFDGQGRRL